MSNHFQGQTNVEAFDVDFNIFFETWPIIFPTNKFSGFIDIEIACQKVVVMPANKLGSNDLKYKRQFLVVQHPINIFPTFFQLCYGLESLYWVSIEIIFLEK